MSINPITNNKVRIKGTSWGIDASYKFCFSAKIELESRASGVLFLYSFDEINQVNSFFGYSNERIVEGYFPPGGITPSITYSTDKYWYNIISLNIGAERRFDLAGSLEFNIGTLLKNYMTFSQVYHITYPDPRGSNYKKNEIRYFGFSAGISGNILKRFKRITIGPEIPTARDFSYWKQDDFFPRKILMVASG